MNARTSRSHAISTLHIRQQRLVIYDEHATSFKLDDHPHTERDPDSTVTGPVPEFQTSTTKFHFVDLTESEQLKSKGATGDFTKEGSSINSGLLALDSVDGSSRTIMIVRTTPSDSGSVETLNTLRHADRAGNIRNHVIMNQDKMSKQLAMLFIQIVALQKEVDEYRQGKRNATAVSTDGAPVDEHLFTKSKVKITNAQIDAYNSIAERVLKQAQNLRIVSVTRKITESLGFYDGIWECHQSHVDIVKDPAGKLRLHRNCTKYGRYSDGYFLSTKVHEQITTVLWNYLCNQFMRFRDSSCCRPVSPPTKVQARCFTLFGICIFCTVLCFLLDRTKCKPAQFHISYDNRIRLRWKFCPSMTFEEFYRLMIALSKLSIILIYMYLCDRTDLVPKQNTIYKLNWDMSTYIFVLFLIVVSSKILGKVTINCPQITMEWRGIAQLSTMIYHFNGADQFLPNYVMARGVLASYLFNSGFGHFHHHWKQPVPRLGLLKLIMVNYNREEIDEWKSDFWKQLTRYMAVIYRMNFFTLVLCPVMQTNYLTYYFMPLISFWYTIAFACMYMFPRVSGHSASTLSVTTDENRFSLTESHSLESMEYTTESAVKQQWPFWLSEIVLLLKVFIVVYGIELLNTSPELFHLIFHSG
ncbi:hypothetical protein P879_00254 [Paragonimus westermani]|uniref:Kinesin motor domain-containing protein n=1 Tax=Paragonimus westermani TaxID=34504 RepID=A0A8T0E0K1_9TREM|nr:hypothetical protein P879_00254 [Paragonimus westermani]